MAEPVTNHPRFSILVAAYNVEEWIDDCLRSLLIDEMRDCEIIVVNDGSTDNTRARIGAYLHDPRLTVIDQPNGGLSAARNTGIERARGAYILFVDGDDWLEPDTLTRLNATLEENPAADLVVFGFYEVYGDFRQPNHCSADLWKMTNSACNKLFSRRLFDGARFDRGIWYEDLALVPYLFVRANAPATLDAVLYNYRRDRDASIMNSTDSKRIYDLPVAAYRCLARIHEGEASGRIAPMKSRFGQDWEARFLTVEIFIPGVLHRARRISDRKTRQQYIARMMSEFADHDSIRADIVRRQYGYKMAAGSLLYRHGHNRLAHWLLHDTGAFKRWAIDRFSGFRSRRRAGTH
ncbi:glycosyltransferase family 2 protein [Salinisphaera sp.]|uniref:glycosyltransferase family 2 protein n=1 Tax=Salinisphaera sp. TaxID=1914330 RepID=UPI002D7836FF|nr:glycosyltransferase family 2 protein [Salinisphaera sp.]HET7313722.1 glycosyltransferase family 2 protein [Salinisphaera sp.]